MKKTGKLSVAVVDDHACSRLGLEGLVRHWPKGRLLFSARHGLEYEARSAEHGTPDLVLLDLSTENRSGLELLEWMQAHQPHTLKVVVSGKPDLPRAHRARQLGAHAILGKDAEPEELLRALEDVRQTQHHQNAVMEGLLALAGTPWSAVDPDEPFLERLRRMLTKREYAVLVRWTREPLRSIPQLAKDMKLSPKTIKTHLLHIHRKLKVHKRAELVLLVHRFGMHKQQVPAPQRSTPPPGPPGQGPAPLPPPPAR